MTESRMRRTHYRSCTLCEAGCGVAVEIDDGRVVGIRGDDADPFSGGYLCPKESRSPISTRIQIGSPNHSSAMARPSGKWAGTRPSFSWRAGSREVRAAHGADALAVYQGNPTVHNLAS